MSLEFCGLWLTSGSPNPKPVNPDTPRTPGTPKKKALGIFGGVWRMGLGD